MAVRIRLKRIGKNPKKRPYFRIAVFEETSSRDARFIDEIGFYNPINGAVKVDAERVAYWLKNGAQASESVKNLLKKSKKE